jgi:hypothetical protein
MSLVGWKQKTPEFVVTYVDEYQKIENMSSLKDTFNILLSDNRRTSENLMQQSDTSSYISDRFTVDREIKSGIYLCYSE